MKNLLVLDCWSDKTSNFKMSQWVSGRLYWALFDYDLLSKLFYFYFNDYLTGMIHATLPQKWENAMQKRRLASANQQSLSLVRL